ADGRVALSARSRPATVNPVRSRPAGALPWWRNGKRWRLKIACPRDLWVRFPPRGLKAMPLLRVLLMLAGLDSLAARAWSALWPASLFELLQRPSLGDFLLLTPALGGLLLFQAGCLLLAGWRPAIYGGLVLLPLAGRLLLCGVWLWLLGSDRAHLPA